MDRTRFSAVVVRRCLLLAYGCLALLVALCLSGCDGDETLLRILTPDTLKICDAESGACQSQTQVQLERGEPAAPLGGYASCQYPAVYELRATWPAHDPRWYHSAYVLVSPTGDLDQWEIEYSPSIDGNKWVVPDDPTAILTIRVRPKDCCQATQSLRLDFVAYYLPTDERLPLHVAAVTRPICPRSLQIKTQVESSYDDQSPKFQKVDYEQTVRSPTKVIA
jgi:hypothetical protein